MFARNLVCLSLTLSGMCLGNGDYTAWSRHIDFRIDTSPTGADIAGDVRNFPLHIRLDKDNFPFHEARPGGSDIRFAKLDGTHLPFQIETWDSAAGTAEIWVLLDQVLANTRMQAVRMHWGREDAKNQSDAAKVFAPEHGHTGVWHLGGSEARPNSVQGGSPALPKRFNGSIASSGLIGYADSLWGASPGTYLDIGTGYADFETGFTFSVWVNPAQWNYWAHFLSLGNGTGYENDNIVVHQVNGTGTVAFLNHTGNRKTASLEIPDALVTGKWSFLTATSHGGQFRFYLDGVLRAHVISTTPITKVFRQKNYLGTSNPSVGGYFNGKMDEPTLARVARSADWIKLSYENQKPGQRVVTVLREPLCVAKFSVPADTVVWESTRLVLKGEADCASEWYWSAMEGPALRILDPAVKNLEISVPKVEKDTLLRLRFSATYGDTVLSKDMVIRVLKEVPTSLTRPARAGGIEKAQAKAGLGKSFTADGRQIDRRRHHPVKPW